MKVKKKTYYKQGLTQIQKDAIKGKKNKWKKLQRVKCLWHN